jgi:hypothetical protein
MTIVSDATIWSVTFDDASSGYDRNCSFMVLNTVITIVNYDRHMFIVQATGLLLRKSLCKLTMAHRNDIRLNATQHYQNDIKQKAFI